MYMLIPMDFIILVNYVYVDSNGFYNTWKVCNVDSVRFYKRVNYVYADNTEFWMLVNYVYADSTGFLNACKLCMCWFQWIL